MVAAKLAEAPKATGAAGIGPNAVPEKYRNEETPTLAELGITKKTSARAQKLSALPDETFERVRSGHATFRSVSSGYSVVTFISIVFECYVSYCFYWLGD